MSDKGLGEMRLLYLKILEQTNKTRNKTNPFIARQHHSGIISSDFSPWGCVKAGLLLAAVPVERSRVDRRQNGPRHHEGDLPTENLA